MKATEQYFTVVLFVMLYMVVLTFTSVDYILRILIYFFLFLLSCLYLHNCTPFNKIPLICNILSHR